MKKIIIIALVIILTSCTINVENITSKLPNGYTKAYCITDKVDKADTLKKFVDGFITEDDFVITVNDCEYIILRK